MPRSRSRCRLLRILRHRVSFVVVSPAASALAAPYPAAARLSGNTFTRRVHSAGVPARAGPGWSGHGSTPPSSVGRVLESGWGRRHLSLLPGWGISTMGSPVSRRCRAAVRSAAAGCRGGAGLDRGRTGRQRTLGSQGGQGPRSEPLMTQQPAVPSAGAPRPRPWPWCRLTGVEGPRWTGPSGLWNTPGGHTLKRPYPRGVSFPF